MNLTGGIVLFAVIWFLVFFVVLQATPGSQADAGDVVPGTPASAPSDARILWKAKITTIITVLIWAAIAAVIFSGLIDIYDLDFFGRLGPRPAG